MTYRKQGGVNFEREENKELPIPRHQAQGPFRCQIQDPWEDLGLDPLLEP